MCASKNDDNNVYEINFKNEALVVFFMFNNFHFCQKGDRSSDECKDTGCRFGSERDVENLYHLFKNLNFDIKYFSDKTSNEIQDIIEEMSKNEYSNVDC